MPPAVLHLAMASLNHAGFRIKSFKDGSLYRARVQKRDESPLTANGKTSEAWETNQCADPHTAIGQAKFAIDTHKIV
jgi:hypothetical protein